MFPLRRRKKPEAAPTRNVYVDDGERPRKAARRMQENAVAETKGPGLGARLGSMFAGGAKTLGWLKSFLLVTLLLAIGAGIVGGACVLSLWLYNEALTSDFFTTRHIDVTGNVRLPREMVLEYGGIREGENCLAVSITQAERQLLETPWVEEVSVKRLLPDRFVIRIKERMPSFWVQREGMLYYANERGEIIAPVESSNFLSLPTLTIEAGAEDEVPYLTRLLKDLRAGRLPVEAGVVASVTLSPGRGVEMYLEDRALRLSIATDDWEGNLRRLVVTLGDLAERQELKNVREVRAVSGEVWVVLRQAARQS